MKYSIALAAVGIISMTLCFGQDLEKDNNKCWNLDNISMTVKADKFNQWHTGEIFPSDLLDSAFDYHFHGGFHGVCTKKWRAMTVCYRKMLLSRVINPKALEAIVNSPNPNYDKLYKPKKLKKNYKQTPIHELGFPPYPYMKLSTRKLASMRLKELNKVKFRTVDRAETNCWVANDNLINAYADSLNFMTPGSRLPNFTFDILIDWRLKGFTSTCLNNNELLSYRQLILDRVYNRAVLDSVANSKDERFDQKYNPELLIKSKILALKYPDLPYMKFSFRELVRRRIKYLSIQ